MTTFRPVLFGTILSRANPVDMSLIRLHSAAEATPELPEGDR